jgi:hypothetical protein
VAAPCQADDLFIAFGENVIYFGLGFPEGAAQHFVTSLTLTIAFKAGWQFFAFNEVVR